MLRDKISGRSDSWQPNWRIIGSTTAALLIAIVVGLIAFDIAVSNRGLGVLRAIAAQRWVLLSAAGLVTQLGDPWFLLLVASLLYLAGSAETLIDGPRSGAFVLAMTFAAFSLTDLLKNVFLAPRPPGAGEVTVPMWMPAIAGDVVRSIATAGEYAFPSGHALGTTVVFAALASQLAVGSPAFRWAAATVGTIAVAATRVVLGVHFLIDIVAGILAGVTLFAIGATIGRRRPLRVFALGIGLGLLAVAASAVSPASEVWKAGQWLGASLGAGGAWYFVRPSMTLDRTWAFVTGTPIAALWVGIYVASPPLPVTVVGTALAAGATVIAPTLAARTQDAS